MQEENEEGMHVSEEKETEEVQETETTSEEHEEPEEEIEQQDTEEYGSSGGAIPTLEKSPLEPEEEMIEIKVYGETKLYPKSQVEAHGGKVAFQKELAADRKFEMAASNDERKRKEWLDKREQELNEKEQHLISQFNRLGQSSAQLRADLKTERTEQGESSTEEETEQLEGEAPNKEQLEEIKKKFDDEFSDIVQDPRLYRMAQHLITTHLARGAKNDWDLYADVGKAVMDHKKKNDAIQSQFAKDFPEVFNDSRLRQMAHTEVEKRFAVGANRYDYQVYADVGEGIRNWTQGLMRNQQGHGDLQKRRERKANIDSIHTASARQPFEGKEAKRTGPKTEAELRKQSLNALKKARGQL